MKKLFLSLSVLASLLVTGCSSDDAVSGNESGDDFTTHYMYVNIMSADGGTTRASDFEYGNDAENKVSKVRFYFFTENGAAANVKLASSGSYQNYFDWTPESDGTPQSEGSSIGKILSATIVINSQEGDKLPRSIVAVLNPTDNLINSLPQGLTTLRAVVNDYAQTNLTKEKTFVMANSVYGNPGTSPIEEVCAAKILQTNICKEKTDAEKNPVTIYVERNVAKVEVILGTNLYPTNETITLTDGTKLLPLKSKKEGEAEAEQAIKVGERDNAPQVYLKLEGWALTAETTEGYLIKRINTQWSTVWWNWEQHRCIWAINSPNSDNKYVPSWSATNIAFNTGIAYTNENAAPNSNGTQTTSLNPTKFLVKGTLCDQSGNALTLVKHQGNLLFADNINSDTDFPELRKSIAAGLTSYNKVTTGDDNSKVYTPMAPEDLKIVANTDNNEIKKYEDSDYNCYVHAELTVAAKAATWCEGTGNDAVSKTADEINTLLRERVNEAMVWKDGQTYYYMPIIHMNYDTTTPETYGVVRNHVYKATITKILGLGTPVYDPDAVIYPEHPDQDDYYIAAQINILAWRIVSDDYSIEW